MTETIIKTVHVPISPDAAFDMFAGNLQAWWPVETHSLSAQSGARPKDITVEPHVGGRIIETMHDGSTVNWATITDWTPGARLSFDWYVGRDPSEATQVAVTFLPEPAGTRVDLTHGGFDRLGSQAAILHQNYHSGWDHVFGTRFSAACATRAA
ncbi:MAG: SRPBCC domain-containing protein [Pseudomonadota bacterium]